MGSVLGQKKGISTRQEILKIAMIFDSLFNLYESEVKAQAYFLQPTSFFSRHICRIFIALHIQFLF